MKLTTLNAVKNRNKFPSSPYKDDSFIFETKQLQTLKECFNVLTEEWILSNSLCLETPIRSVRTIKELSKYRCDYPGITTIDIDDIKSYEDMKFILEYFKNTDYNLILGKSKNWDGVNKFNLKGFIETSFKNTRENCKNFLIIINENIIGKGKIDLNSASDVSLQAPLFRDDIFLYQTSNNIEIDDEFLELNLKYIITKKQSEFIQYMDTTKLLQICFDIFRKKGFTTVSSRSNNTINWEHPSEVVSKGGYFTYIETPHIMHHNNAEKSLNIFNEIKLTKEGQEFIKEATSFNLKKQFEEHKKSYSKELYINEQLITIDNTMINFIESFLNNGKILKVKSAMGTGKSLIIDESIKQAKKMNKRVLLISNRISVANDYAKKYNIKTYQYKEDDIWKSGEDLIVQMDSIWKYDLRDFDIVILDEFISLLFQSLNSMQNNMRPFNSSKLYYILKGKQCILADAFLSGYEDRYYDNKSIYYIQNDYRDLISITNYEYKETFVEQILETLKNKESNETITASIISTDVLNAIYELCTKNGFKAFKLTGNTSEMTKETIYNLFKQDENEHWDILLYSPTLTVGVSNMNNCTHHFHFDRGNAVDVISSLQMVKRTRKMKHLHLFLKDRLKLEPTDDETINDLFKQNIEKYFKGSVSGIIDIDENGNFTLSKIGKFINSIQSFFNLLENNHKMTFNVLLKEQFNVSNIEHNNKKSKLEFNKIVKETKEKNKNEIINLIDNYNSDYSENIIELLKTQRTLTEEEKVSLILYEIEQKLNTKDKHIINGIAKEEISSNMKFTNYMKYFTILYKRDLLFINNYIDNIISSGVNSQSAKEELNFMKDIQKLTNFKLSEWYSQKEIKEVEQKYKLTDFKSILYKIGFYKKESRYILKKEIIKYLRYFI